VGQLVKKSIADCKEDWAVSLRQTAKKDGKNSEEDAAFYGPHTLLSTDQGIRGLLTVTNDLCYLRAKDLELEEWRMEGGAGASDEKAVSSSLTALKRRNLASFLAELGEGFAQFDWRSSSAPGLTEVEKTRKAALRGGSGYRELRQDLLKNLVECGKTVGRAAKEVLSAQIKA
jgi:hypothetical protein